MMLLSADAKCPQAKAGSMNVETHPKSYTTQTKAFSPFCNFTLRENTASPDCIFVIFCLHKALQILIARDRRGNESDSLLAGQTASNGGHKDGDLAHRVFHEQLSSLSLFSPEQRLKGGPAMAAVPHGATGPGGW